MSLLKSSRAFTPLENAADSSRRLHTAFGDGGVMTPSMTVKEQSSLTGFTIIEIIGVIAVLSLVAGVTFLILGGAVRGHLDFTSQNDLLGRGRAGFEKIVDDLRSIRSPEDIMVWGPSQIRFINSDGVEQDINFNAGQILNNGQVLLDHLSTASGFAITYYDGSGNLLVPSGSGHLIRLLGVSVVLESSVGNLPLYTEVFPRNFQSGLGSWTAN